jgi:hypothetical protein
MAERILPAGLEHLDPLPVALRSRAPITVVVPTIPEHADLLERALASVHAQNVQPAEIVVIHDNGHVGAAWARNRGLEQVETPWVAWLDADDVLYRNHLEVLWMRSACSHADLIYPCMRVVDDRGLPARDPTATLHRGQIVNPCGVPFGDEQAGWLLQQGNFIPITYLVKTEVVRAVGGFPPNQGPKREEDYLLLCNLLRADPPARFEHVEVITWEYHLHDRNTGGGGPGTGASNQGAFRG